MITEIRPKMLFQKVEERFPDENVMFSVNLPSSEIGGLTLLESSILVALLKLLSPTEMFEFGTFHGATSVLLATNSPENARLVTVDLPAESIPTGLADTASILSDGVENDVYLQQRFAARGAYCIDRASHVVRDKITRWWLDSRRLVVAPHAPIHSRFDFIFIDGGHDLETISKDTANALLMAKEDAVIIWHDYQSAIHTEVTAFVEAFGATHRVVHVQSTMLAFTLRGRYRSLL